MTMAEPGGAARLIDRVRNLLLHPSAEWERIKGEQTSLQALLVGYVLPLVALSALCGFIGATFVSQQRLPLPIALGEAVVFVVLMLVIVWVIGLIINAIAPSFGAAQDQMQANKLAAYFPTAGWLAYAVKIVPSIAILGLVGFYSYYLLYVGLPRVMNVPQDKKVGYFVTIMVITLIAGIVVALATGAVQGLANPGVAPVTAG